MGFELLAIFQTHLGGQPLSFFAFKHFVVFSVEYAVCYFELSGLGFVDGALLFLAWVDCFLDFIIGYFEYSEDCEDFED